MRLKRMCSIFMALVMTVTLSITSTVPVAAETTGYWTDAENVSTVPPDYDFATHTYTIDNAAELAWVATEVNSVAYNDTGGATFILSNDIDLAGHFWVPIGEFQQHTLTGTFDGNGYTISNMTIGTASEPSTLTEAGLIGYADDAVIKDINMTDVSIYTSVADNVFIKAGAIVGMAFSSTISDCSVAGIISGSGTLAVSSSRGVGGIVGLSTSDIERCSSSINIIAGGSMLPVGGLVGLMTGGNITESYATGNVSGSGAKYIGGLVGFAEGGGTISDSYATGDVTGGGSSDAGGLVGHSYYNIESCFAIGEVYGGDCAGGLVGFGRAGNITNSFASGNVTSSNTVGGLIGMSLYSGLSSVTNCYASGDINTSQSNVINQSAGGLIGYRGTTVDTIITNAYWNKDATQIVDGVARNMDSKLGIGRATDDSTAKSWDEMTDVAFADLLSANNGALRDWTSVYDLNDGYPYLEGLYFTTPSTTNTVTFRSLETDYKVMHVTEGISVMATMTDPTQAHFDFTGWTLTSDGSGSFFDFTTSITEDTTLYAQWAPKPTYSVLYNANGGLGDAPFDINTYEEDGLVTMPSGSGLTKANYIFGGWTLSSDGSGTVYAAGATYTMGSGDTELYAKWNPSYTVTYHANSGVGTEPIDSNAYTPGSFVTLLSGSGLTKESFRFAGWTINSGGSGTVFQPDGTYYIGSTNINFYAKWTPTYTVTYDVNGGTGTTPVDSNAYAQGEPCLLASGSGLTNGNLNFGGWVDEDGNKFAEADYYHFDNTNVTLYARWTNYWTDFGNVATIDPDLEEDTDTYIIDNAAELAWVAKQVNDGNDFSGYTIKIADSVTDIDLSGHDWFPIGSDYVFFRGDFDGNNKKISNLTIGTVDMPNTELIYAGLFGGISESTISNVWLEDVLIYSSAVYAEIGGLIGYADNISIINSHTSGRISGGESVYIGGLIGDVYTSTILDAYATVDVTSGDDAVVGGLAGYAYGSMFTNNYATGNLSGGINTVMGGFIGYDDEDFDNNSIAYGYWNGDASQIIAGSSVDVKVGIGMGPNEASVISKTSDAMKNNDFAMLLNVNKSGQTTSTWTILPSVNNDYPVLANTVTFDKNGGTADASPSTKLVVLGGSVGTLPTAPVRTGYTFSGWNTVAGGSGATFTPTTTVTEDMTVYAQWTLISAGNNSGSTRPTVPSDDVDTTSFTAQTNTATGTATADVGASEMTSLTDKAKASETVGQKAVIEIKVEASVNAKTVEVVMDRTAFDKVANDTKADVKVTTGLGSITFDAEAVNTISGAAGTGNITISMAKVETSTLSGEMQQAVGNRPVYDLSVSAGSSNISEFGNGKATISIPYTPEAGEDDDAIVVYYIDSEGKLNPVKGKYDAASGTVVFTTNHFSEYMIGYNKVSFSDVVESSWYRQAVTFIAARNITTGTDATHYSPNAKLTRGQFITMLMRAYGIEADESGTDNFADAGDTYYTGYLSKAKALGITKGIGDNLFVPNQEITRQEMFTLLYNTLGVIGELPTEVEGNQIMDYIDANLIASWAEDAMTLFVGTEIVSGHNGKLSPTDTTNRAEMAQVLYNLLEK